MKDLLALKEVPMTRPKCFDCHIIFQSYVMCCFRSKWYRDYMSSLDEIDTDLSRNLNIVDNIRRLRMHGLALTSMFDINQRSVISAKCAVKSLSNVAEFEPNTMW